MSLLGCLLLLVVVVCRATQDAEFEAKLAQYRAELIANQTAAAQEVSIISPQPVPSISPSPSPAPIIPPIVQDSSLIIPMIILVALVVVVSIGFGIWRKRKSNRRKDFVSLEDLNFVFEPST